MYDEITDAGLEQFKKALKRNTILPTVKQYCNICKDLKSAVCNNPLCPYVKQK